MAEKVVPLTELSIPTLVAEQLGKFTMESVHPQEYREFDGQLAVESLKAMNGQRVLAADFGGDKGVTQLFEARDGRLSAVLDYEDYVQGDKGAGYLASLERTASYAKSENIPVGISWGGPIHGSVPATHPKAAIFLQELQTKYDGDLANVLPTLKSSINDGPAGLITGAIEVNRNASVDNILLPINGGGLGMSVLNSGKIYATEAGHVEAVAALNDYNQIGACGVFGADYLCIESLGANKTGVEVQWQAATGEYMRARDIEDRYKEGNELARELYDHSALVVAHMIAGTAKAFGIDLYSTNTAVVCHGGAFNFPAYGDRIGQILTTDGVKPTTVLTNSFAPKGSNACLVGAAYSALLSAN